jgi:hypothetical protein
MWAYSSSIRTSTSFLLVLLAGALSALGCAKGTEIPETEVVYLQPLAPSVPDAGVPVDGEPVDGEVVEPVDGDGSKAFAPEEAPADEL